MRWGSLILFLVFISAVCATDVNELMAGRTVVGQIARPAIVHGRHDWELPPSSFDRDVELPTVSLPPDILQKTPAQRAAWFEQWKQTAEGKRALQQLQDAKAERTVDFVNGRTFRLKNLEPGSYTLPAFFYQGSPPWDHALASVSYRFTVPPIPEGASDTPLDVGELQPESQGGSNLGQVAPDFAFQTIDGNDHTLGEFKGKVILLEFWGTWCPGCVMDIPHLKEIHDTFGSDPRFVMISLSARDKLEKLKPFIEEHQMTWSQVMLGDDKEACPLVFYQVSGFPSYWLIDRDGKTIYNDWRSDDLKSAVTKVLGK